jgi:hypothetical protein
MSSDFEQRASQRRQSWQGATAKSPAEIEAQDRLFWRSASPSARFDAVCDLAIEAWRMKRGAEPAPRLSGSAVGIRKRKG